MVYVVETHLMELLLHKGRNFHWVYHTAKPPNIGYCDACFLFINVEKLMLLANNVFGFQKNNSRCHPLNDNEMNNSTSLNIYLFLLFSHLTTLKCNGLVLTSKCAIEHIFEL